jgi:FkbM family methyltransferase
MYSIRKYFGGPDSIAVDVGANIGNHAIFFRSFLIAHPIAVEPNPDVLPTLTGNLERNIDRFKIYPIGMGDSSTHGTIVPPDSSKPNQGSIRVEVEGEDKGIGTHSIEIRTLDSMVAEWRNENVNSGRITLLKIDVEGMEIDVLRGAKETIGKDRPHLFIEATTLEEFAALNAHLEPLGYVALNKWGYTAVYHFAHPPPRHLLIISSKVKTQRLLGRIKRKTIRMCGGHTKMQKPV